MKITMFTITFLFCSIWCIARAEHSIIVDADGYACMGEDKSRKQTEEYALLDVKRKAGELAVTYLKSETQVKNFTFEKDIMNAYTNATVRILQEIDKGWYKDVSMGDCYKIKIKAEVAPYTATAMQAANASDLLKNSSAPLFIQAWTDKKEYSNSEDIKIYVQGNKPFYARVVNIDPSGVVVQLIPNPYRVDNYFSETTVHQIPSMGDQFELEVTSPFGKDTVIVFASTSPLGDIDLKPQGGVYEVKTKLQDIGVRTRGIKLKTKSRQDMPSASEFYEKTISVKTINDNRLFR